MRAVPEFLRIRILKFSSAMQNFHNSVTLVGVGKEATMSDRTFECMTIPVRQN